MSVQTFLRGFVDELTKLGADEYRDVLQEARKEVRRDNKGDKEGFSIRRGGGPVRRDYVTSTLISAASFPLLAIAGKAIGRKMHNRDVLRAIKQSPGKAKALKKELQHGPLVGRGRPDLPANKRPVVTHSEIAADAGKGALVGSVLQAIRDRYSGAGRSE